MENKKQKSFISNLNSNINKISKIFLLLICVIYALVLGAILTITVKEQDYIILPSYEHVYFNEDVNPQISLIPVRTYDESGKMTLKYTVRVYVYGRLVGSSSSDPGYNIKNLKVSASVVDSVSSNLNNKMYYFTEYSSYTTPVQHSYTIDNSTISQHPYDFYTQVQYKKGGNNIISTFKEKVFLQPTASERTTMDNYYEANKESQNVTGISFTDKEGKALGTMQFISTPKDDVYTLGTKITMNTLSSEAKYHIDMQSWIETSDENGTNKKYLPFLGVYSYSSQRNNYIQSGWDVDKQSNPKFVCAKLVYYFSDTDYKEFYFRQDITKLATEFTTSPVTGDEDYNIKDNQRNNKPLIYIGIGAGIGIIAITVMVTVIYFVKIRAKKETEKVEENDKIKEN